MPLNNALSLLQMHLNIERALASESQALYLCNLNLNDIPLSITRINHLLRLYLSHNNISSIPKEICQFVKLHTLSLDYNNLQSFPSFMCSLHTLVKLNLNHNPIRIIPIELFNLTNLEVLWLNHTEISEIPLEINKLTKLDTFGARGNNISNLPDEFGSLEALRWVTLQENRITHLPEHFNLTSLVHINLSSNLLTEFPVSFTKLKELQFCFLAGNLIRNMPDDLIDQVKHIKLLDLHKNPLISEESIKDYQFITTWLKRNPANESEEEEEEEEDGEDWAESVASSDLNTSDEEDIADDVELLRGGAVLWLPLMSKLFSCSY